MIPLVLEAAARSLVLGLAVWLVLAVLRPHNPYLHRTVWLGVLLASLAMPLLLWSEVAPAIEAPSYFVSLSAGETPVAGAMGKWLGLGEQTGISRVMPALATLYAMVVVTLLARFAMGFVRIGRIRRRAQVLNTAWVGADDIRVSDGLFGPATFGSTILLPLGFEQWSPSKLAAVLCHERSHVRQKDCYVLWLARLHACVFWINPLAWLILRRLAALAETVSDDAVVSETGDGPGYAQMLLEIAAARPAAPDAVMAMARPNVSWRIERIISDAVPAAPAKRWHKALSIALLVPMVVVCAATLQVPGLAFAQGNGVADDASVAKIVSWPPGLEKWYPPAAKVAGREGLVRITIMLDADAQVIGTQVLQEEPQMFGFGEAAEALVRANQYSNPTGQATQITINVRFALSENEHYWTNPARPPVNQVGG
jgi:TonB family protein